MLPTLASLGPMQLKGIVTKVGFMNKTATVTVTRQVVHKRTGKVRSSSSNAFFFLVGLI
jgi:ribosomal protein S17